MAFGLDFIDNGAATLHFAQEATAVTHAVPLPVVVLGGRRKHCNGCDIRILLRKLWVERPGIC